MRLLLLIFFLATATKLPAQQQPEANERSLLITVTGDSGRVLSTAEVFLSSPEHGKKLPVQFDQQKQGYYLEAVPGGYNAVSASCAGYISGGWQWSGEMPPQVKLELMKKEDTFILGRHLAASGQRVHVFYQPMSRFLYIVFKDTRAKAELLEQLEMEEIRMEFIGPPLYVKKNGQDFDRFNCRELRVLREHPAVKLACNVFHWKSSRTLGSISSLYPFYRSFNECNKAVILFTSLTIRADNSALLQIEEFLKDSGFRVETEAKNPELLQKPQGGRYNATYMSLELIDSSVGEGFIDLYRELVRREEKYNVNFLVTFHYGLLN